MHTLKFDVEQKHLYDLNFEVLKEIHQLYHVPAAGKAGAPAKVPARELAPKWLKDVEGFKNPRVPFMDITVDDYSMAFATQLRKLSKLSPKVPTITLTIDNLQKFDLRQYHTPEEIYDALNF
ncbi:MAG: hypothetical protein V1839_03170 [archaeon]